MAQKIPLLQDREGTRVPFGLPPVIDAHVHIFPDRIAEAIWCWFGMPTRHIYEGNPCAEKNAWDIRYKGLQSQQVAEYLLSRGVSHVVALGMDKVVIKIPYEFINSLLA